MKILTICDQGNNRSVQFAHLLKYWKNDCIPVGLKTNSPETLKMLANWADKIVFTEESQVEELSGITQELYDHEKILVLEVGPDNYPRPFNPELLAKAKELLEENKSILKS